jgi:hypothetical protein
VLRAARLALEQRRFEGAQVALKEREDGAHCRQVAIDALLVEVERIVVAGHVPEAAKLIEESESFLGEDLGAGTFGLGLVKQPPSWCEARQHGAGPSGTWLGL